MAAPQSISEILSQGFPVPVPPQLNARAAASENLSVEQKSSFLVRELLAYADIKALGCEDPYADIDASGKDACLLECLSQCTESSPSTPRWGCKDIAGESPSTVDHSEVASDGTTFEDIDAWSFDNSPRTSPRRDYPESVTSEEEITTFLHSCNPRVREMFIEATDMESAQAGDDNEAVVQPEATCAKSPEGDAPPAPCIAKKYGVVARAVEKIAAARLSKSAPTDLLPRASSSSRSSSPVSSVCKSSEQMMLGRETFTTSFEDPAVPIVVSCTKEASVLYCAGNPLAAFGNQQPRSDALVLLGTETLSANQPSSEKDDQFSSEVAARLHGVLRRLDDIAQSWALDLPAARGGAQGEAGSAHGAGCSSSPSAESYGKLGCPAGHPLFRTYKVNKWICDVCEKSFLDGVQVKRHRCARCDYDVCDACSFKACSKPSALLARDHDGALAHMSPRTLHNEVAMPLMKSVEDLGNAYVLLDEANARHLRLRGSFLPEAFYNQACCLSLGADAAMRCPSKAIPGLPPGLDEAPANLAEKRLDLAMERLEMAIKAGYREFAHMSRDTDLNTLREFRSMRFAPLIRANQT